MKFIYILVLLVVPLVLCLAGDVLTGIIYRNLKLFPWVAPVLMTLFISTVVYFTLRWSFDGLGMKSIEMGNLVSLAVGLFIGVLISLISAVGVAYFKDYSINYAVLFENLPFRFGASSYPALVEELVFRGGMVEFFTQSFGRTIGLLSGSVPFGVLHILGKLFGNIVTFSQVIGISVAGLMLSLIYMKFGLLGAFGCHWIWNAFIVGWVKSYQTSDTVNMATIEGHWFTCIVLSITCACVYFLLTKKPAT